MEKQLSMFDYVEPQKPKAPEPVQGEPCRIIPADVWERRCKYCVHRMKNVENIPVPVAWLGSYRYDKYIPCRILSIVHMDRPGECGSFRPEYNVSGVCGSCKHNRQFADGFCSKADHAEQKRVYYSGDYGGDERNRDYWGRHVQCVCADYEPVTCATVTMGE